MKTRVVFFGTPDFAAKFLEGLLNDPFFDVVAVVAQPDAVLGRKKVLTPPPTKLLAERHGILVLQPTKLKDPVFQEKLKSLSPDLGVIIAYGRILPAEVINFMPKGLINVHPSLLPRWRGPSPVQAAIAAGDAVSGVSVMKIDAEMDHGPILQQVQIPVENVETPQSFFAKVVEQGVPVFLGSVKNYVAGILQPQEQDHSQATYCKLLTRDDGRINWSELAEVILRKMRAYTPWPGVWSHDLKIHAAVPSELDLKPGQVVVDGERLFVGTGSKALEVLELQSMAGKRLPVAEWLRGQRQLPVSLA